MSRLFQTAAFLIALVVALPAQAMDIQRVTSPGGIEAWLVRDVSVPIISVSFSFEGGQSSEPDDRNGLADMVSSLLDEGAGDLDSQAFQLALKDISASIGFSAGRDRFNGTLRTLAENRDRAFELLALALNKPRFDPEAIERIRGQILASLKSQSENPRRIAGRLLYGEVFGTHPYGKPVFGTPESIGSITRDDLVSYATQRLARRNLKIGVVGDITPEALGPLLDQVFLGLPSSAAQEVSVTAPTIDNEKMLVVRKPIPQSVIRFASAGLLRSDPRYYAAVVMNYILGGGGFNSRLTEEIREKRGLVYSVFTFLNPMDKGGLLMGGLGTRNESVPEALNVLEAEIRKIHENGVTAEELAAAKAYINGSFPLRLDSGRRIAGLLVAIQVHDLGIDYVNKRADLINAVTQEDVRAVANHIFGAPGATRTPLIVIVGDPKGLKPESYRDVASPMALRDPSR